MMEDIALLIAVLSAQLFLVFIMMQIQKLADKNRKRNTKYSQPSEHELNEMMRTLMVNRHDLESIALSRLHKELTSKDAQS